MGVVAASSAFITIHVAEAASFLLANQCLKCALLQRAYVCNKTILAVMLTKPQRKRTETETTHASITMRVIKWTNIKSNLHSSVYILE